MDCIVHGVAKNGTGLSDFYFHFSSISQDISSVLSLKTCLHPQGTVLEDCSLWLRLPDMNWIRDGDRTQTGSFMASLPGIWDRIHSICQFQSMIDMKGKCEFASHGADRYPFLNEHRQVKLVFREKQRCVAVQIKRKNACLSFQSF